MVYTYERNIDYKQITVVAVFVFMLLFIFYIKNRSLEKEVSLKQRFNKKLSILNEKLADKNILLKQLSEIDPLTKIANRRKLNKALKHEFARAQREYTTFSIIMFDIDHFKKVNDTYGHDVGDEVLYNLSQLISKNIRSLDIFGRYGGEEFLIISPNASIQQAYILCEKIQMVLKDNKSAKVLEKNCTVSFGISQYYNQGDTQTMLKEADEQLYLAKEHGRDEIYPKVKV